MSEEIRNEFMERLAAERAEPATTEPTEEPTGDPEVEEVLEDGYDDAVDTEGELDTDDTEALEGDRYSVLAR